MKNYKPEAQVLVIKTVGRTRGVSERFRGPHHTRHIDLSRFLGDGSAINTNKDIREPAGTFSITFADRLSVEGQDSLYGLLEPMDYVEIRMAREPHKYNGQLPIVMRGFISKVARSESVDSEGKPQRTVTLAGHDYGKMFQIEQIFYERHYLLEQNILTQFKFYANQDGNTTAGSQPMKSSKFISIMLEAVNDRIAGVLKNSLNKRLQRVDEKLTVTTGTVGHFGINPAEGDIWSLMKKWSDEAWNELFIIDEKDGPVLYYRPRPQQDAYKRNQFIQKDATDPGETTITADDMVHWNPERSDANVANYFWTYSARGSLNSNELLTRVGIQDASGKNVPYFQKDHDNCALNLYGLRKMEVQFQQLQTNSKDQGTNQSESANAVNNISYESWVKARRDILISANRDNIVFEKGDGELKGNEKIKPGRFLRVNRGGLSWRQYVTVVDHSYIPFQIFKTNVQFERGEGFLVRSESQGNAYNREIGRGVYGE